MDRRTRFRGFFTVKSYGSSSWRQICWPVFMHEHKPRSLPVLFWCVPFPLCWAKGNISAPIKAGLGSLWVAVMFLVSCYYTVSSFRRSVDVSSKNLHCTELIDMAFASSSMKQASSIFPPSCCPTLLFSLKSISLFLFRTFPHTSFVISVYRISLLCPFILLFSSLILTALSHLAAENLCFVCVCVCVRMCVRAGLQNQPILHYQYPKGAYDGMEICSAQPLIVLQ